MPVVGSVSYAGVADWWGRHVWVEHNDIRIRLPYAEGSVIAFAWGRSGHGARELARAILKHATGELPLTERLSGAFVHDVICCLPDIGFELAHGDVLAWVHSREP